MKDTNKIFYLLLFVVALAVNFAGINVNFFTDDPGLYATIAKTLLYKKDFFELYTYNQDWLDKPHFPFWMVLASFKLFGVSVWAYRLPALLFFTLSLVYTWLLARKYYGWQVAFTAVMILMTAVEVLLSNTDTRAEPYLMALIPGAIYHIAKLNERYSFGQLLMAALLTACAIMTKGIFVIIAIYGALLGQLIFQKQFKQVFKLKWLALGVLTIVFVLPEFYALYTQFDLHPEKTVFGRHNVSGIKWFLWDSQFGRFINSGPISREATGSKFFYLHTLLWAFAPWCLVFYYAVFKNIKQLFRGEKLAEYYSISGGLLLLVLFSLSGFQLPFYTNSVFPLFAIFTAPFYVNQLSKLEEKFRAISQWVFIILLPIIVAVLNYFLRPANYLLFWVDVVLFALIIFAAIVRIREAHFRLFVFSCAAALFVGFYLNTVLFNQITPYKGEIAAAHFINQKQFDSVRIYSVKFENNNFQFYCKRPVDFVPIDKFDQFTSPEASVFYVNGRSMDTLVKRRAKFTILKSFINYPQENIMPRFINETTRHDVLNHVFLITRPIAGH
jgi:4-amino-4-deoxy-L-arabinose transferase-like glycosyltransferase